MIRKVKSHEIPKITEILTENFKTKITADPYVNYVVYEDTVLKGILSYSFIYDRMELNYIWVETFYRRQGIGMELLQYLHEIAYENHVHNISLEVACDNEAAIHLYEKLGYKKVALREKYYHGIDGILMVKEMIK